MIIILKMFEITQRSLFPQLLVGICIVFGAIGQLLMKNGMSQVGEIGALSNLINYTTISQILTNLSVVGGLFMYAIASFLWLGALSMYDVSYIYPLLSLGYVFTSILSMVFLHENVTIQRWVGIITVVFGCILILRS